MIAKRLICSFVRLNIHGCPLNCSKLLAKLNEQELSRIGESHLSIAERILYFADGVSKENRDNLWAHLRMANLVKRVVFNLDSAQNKQDDQIEIEIGPMDPVFVHDFGDFKITITAPPPLPEDMDIETGLNSNACSKPGP